MNLLSGMELKSSVLTEGDTAHEDDIGTVVKAHRMSVEEERVKVSSFCGRCTFGVVEDPKPGNLSN